jgi:hypothetical protein
VTPYYTDDAVTLWHGDCLEVDAWLAADVLVTDPPYGMGYVSNFSKYGATAPIAADGDTSARDAALALWRSGDDTRPALMFGTWRIARPRLVRQLVVWDKGDTPGMGDLSIPWGPAHEEVYVLGDGWSGRRRANVYRVPTLPAMAGYRPGSTLVAARNLGRKAIGVELEERYCEVIAKRLAQDVLDFGGGAA